MEAYCMQLNTFTFMEDIYIMGLHHVDKKQQENNKQVHREESK